MPFQSTFARRLFIGILTAAYIAALTPFTTYIGEADFILNMVIVVGFASIAMTIAGAYAAFQALGRDKHKIAIPERLQHSQTLCQWWIAFRYTRRYQWWLVLPRLGLAYAFVQLLYIGNHGWWWIDSVFNAPVYTYTPYVYGSINYDSIPHTFVYPQWETWCIATVFILIYALVEAGLLSAFAIFALNFVPSVRVSVALIFRYGILLSLIGLFMILPAIYTSTPLSTCSLWDRSDDEEHDAYWSCFHSRHDVVETVHISAMTIFGRGVLLSANIMRPIGEGTLFASDCVWGHQSTRENCMPTEWDNRLFVLRQMVAGVLGLLMYGALTGGVLWLSTRRNIFNHSQIVTVQQR